MSFHDPREGLRPVTKRRCHPLNPVVFVGILDVHNSGVFVLAITECCLGTTCLPNINLRSDNRSKSLQAISQKRKDIKECMATRIKSERAQRAVGADRASAPAQLGVIGIEGGVAIMRPGPLLLLLSCFILQGCASNPLPMVSQVAVPEVSALPANLPSRPLLLDRVVFDVPKGTVLGEKRQGNLCVHPAPLIWESGVLEYSRGDYHNEFENMAKQYNFCLVEKPTSLFGTSISTGNELLLAARILVTGHNLCSARTFSQQIPIRKGNVRFSVHWEVFSVAEKKVVFVFENESSGVLEIFAPFGEDNYFVKAFRHSLKGLLNDERFRALVSSFPTPDGRSGLSL